MNRRNITIAVVAVLAIGLGLVAYGVLLTPHKTEPPVRAIVVAAMKVPARAHIIAPMVTVTTRPADQVQSDALGNPSDAIGQIATIDIPEGGIITSGALAKPTPVPVGLQVPPGMRAVSITVDQVKGVSGLVKPGDKVDVLAIPPRGIGNPQAYTFLRDITVLAVGSDYLNPQAAAVQSANPAAPTPPPAPAGTITLSVNPEQADELAANDLNAVVRLALRPPNERASSQPVQPVEYPQVAKSASTSSHPGVTVINGDATQL